MEEWTTIHLECAGRERAHLAPARGVSSFTGDEGVLRGQDFPVAVALFKDVFQVSP
jgi:hypothetical protein